MSQHNGSARQHRLTYIVFASALMSEAALGHSAARPASQPPPAPEPDITPAAVVEEAERVVGLIQRQQDLGESVTLSFLQLKSTVAKQLWFATRELAREKAAASLE